MTRKDLSFPIEILLCLLLGMLVGHFTGHLLHHHPVLWGIAVGAFIIFGIGPFSKFLGRKIAGEKT